ncbi:MAG: hypothetical protein ACREFP_19095 [Acetobacteraceae bacterium]
MAASKAQAAWRGSRRQQEAMKTIWPLNHATAESFFPPFVKLPA